MIGESGVVCGEICVFRIIINGWVEGDVNVIEYLELVSKV